MSVSALSWHDDRSPRELARWAIAGAIVLGVHAGALIGDASAQVMKLVSRDLDRANLAKPGMAPKPDVVPQAAE